MLVFSPKEPQSEKPWCKKCRGHTAYQEKIHSQRTSNRHGVTSVSYHCKVCDNDMFKPKQWHNIFVGGAIFGLLMLPTFVYLLTSKHSIPTWLLVVTGGLALVSVYMSFYSYLQYANWKKWAKERGWEEEKP